MKLNDLKYEVYIGATPEKVWDALISPEGIKKLYSGSTLKSTFETGSPLEYVGPGPDGKEVVHIYGKVLNFEPNKTFRHTCRIGEAWGAQHANFESRVAYELEPVGPCTKLTLIHDQWMERDPAYAGSLKNWPKHLSSLKTYVETGEVLDLPLH